MDKKLLVVDSEPLGRNIIRQTFNSICSIKFAPTLSRAEKILKSFQPGIVFFELRSADINQLSEMFHAVHIYSPESFVIVSVSENTDELERYARINSVFYYMIRPFNLNELWDAVSYGFRAIESRPQHSRCSVDYVLKIKKGMRKRVT